MKILAIICVSLAYFFLPGSDNYRDQRVLQKERPGKVLSADTTKLGGQWYLQPVLPSDTGFLKTPFLKLDMSKKMASGNNGCNSFTGGFTYTDTSISFDKNMATTKMACIGYDESAFMRNLLRVDGYKLKEGMLILKEGATEISRWARKPATRPVIRQAAAE